MVFRDFADVSSRPAPTGFEGNTLDDAIKGTILYLPPLMVTPFALLFELRNSVSFDLFVPTVRLLSQVTSFTRNSPFPSTFIFISTALFSQFSPLFPNPILTIPHRPNNPIPLPQPPSHHRTLGRTHAPRIPPPRPRQPTLRHPRRSP
jgi:hypothetical protein